MSNMLKKHLNYVQTDRKRKIFLMFVAYSFICYSFICFACSFVFFAFALGFVWCQ